MMMDCNVFGFQSQVNGCAIWTALEQIVQYEMNDQMTRHTKVRLIKIINYLKDGSR